MKPVAQLDRQIKQFVAPELTAAGFLFDGRRTFRRGRDSGAIEIVNFQVGVRALAGRFTCNLAVYHPRFTLPGVDVDVAAVTDAHCMMDLRQRLGKFRPLGLIRRMMNAPREDYWWPQHADETRQRRELEEVITLLRGPGLAWLQEHSTDRAVEAAFRALAHRRAAKHPDREA